MDVLNIAAYKFIALDHLPALKVALSAELTARALSGTVLLAEEGINLFLAGSSVEINHFLTWLRLDARFTDLQVKESFSNSQPFRKLLVKIKPEIIRMNHPAIQPAAGRAPAVDAARATHSFVY